MLLSSPQNPASPPKRPFLWIDKEIANEFNKEAEDRMKELRMLTDLSANEQATKQGDNQE